MAHVMGAGLSLTTPAITMVHGALPWLQTSSEPLFRKRSALRHRCSSGFRPSTLQAARKLLKVGSSSEEWVYLLYSVHCRVRNIQSPRRASLKAVALPGHTVNRTLIRRSGSPALS